MDTEVKKANRIIKLNVGGVKYCTYESTLLSDRQTFFTGLLGGRFEVAKDEEGCIFIDRNGKYFEPVLDYLRDGVWKCPKDLDEEKALDEAEFYGLTLLGSDNALKYILSKKYRQKVVANQKLQQLAEDIWIKLVENEGGEVVIGPSFQRVKEDFVQQTKTPWDVLEREYHKKVHIVCDEVDNGEVEKYLKEVYGLSVQLRSTDKLYWDLFQVMKRPTSTSSTIPMSIVKWTGNQPTQKPMKSFEPRHYF